MNTASTAQKRRKNGEHDLEEEVAARAPEADAPDAMPDRLLDMQRRAGNSSVNAYVQTKLEVGPADDQYEREADEIASQVVGHHDPHDGGGTAHAGGEGFAASGELAQFVGRGGGAPLAPAVRRQLEPSFGLGFADVRVHDDAATAQMAESIGARAFTHGNDVYFGKGAYAPGSPSGDHLLAHELAHVAQQTGSAQRKIARKFDGAKVPTRLSARRIQGNFLKKAKTMVTNLTGKSKEDKRAQTGEEKLDSKSKPELQNYMARTKGGGPSENPDWSNPKFFGQEPTKFKVKLAVAQEDANWLKNAKELRNVGLKTALSSKGRKELFEGADPEATLGKKVLEQRGELDGLSDEDVKAKVKAFTGSIHDVGHTWIRLETYVGEEVKDIYSYGMWPAKVTSLVDSDDNHGGYGKPYEPGQGEVRHPDNMHEDDAMKMYFTHNAKKKDFEKALTRAGELYASPPPYVLLGYNCTTFAKEIFQTAGGSYPSKGKLLPGFAYTPGNLYDAIAKQAKAEEKTKKKPGKRKAAKEDEHKDLVGKISEKQKKLAEAGVRDTQSEAFAVPDDDAKTSALTFYAGNKFRWGHRPDFAEDNKTTLDKNKQMTAVDNPEVLDRWDAMTFWLGPKKYMYIPEDDAQEAAEDPKKKKVEEKKVVAPTGGLRMYNGQGGGFKKPLPTDPVVRTFDKNDALVCRVESTDGEWVNVVNIRSGEYFWCKATHLEWTKNPTGEKPKDYDGDAPKVEEKPKVDDEDEGLEPMVSAKGIPIYDTMVGMKAVALWPTDEAKFATFDQMNDDWRIVMVDSRGAKDHYVREEDFEMWKRLTGFKG